MHPAAPYENRHRRAPPCTPEHSPRFYISSGGWCMGIFGIGIGMGIGFGIGIGMIPRVISFQAWTGDD